MAWVPVLEQAIEAELALDAMMDLVHASGSHDSTRPSNEDMVASGIVLSRACLVSTEN
eukprot:CAMPEP_0175832670 /NCGR_PEP_ID=MMETSP0107_2-20121207/15111_1 /TAXON_ID=195067 ORGANISM="Goniomonas pacifica, Strain CCMP1869" /NCGR_SAMPLE_ID=MMETSP0107_2 /ASSEMBLY_ACC=CAM_ASM_000203 /LENGTH=57 /DNA_ID=CAMNT_0017145769 /DNA_START=638 /DNA_END=811 /DNA_ORIENTATION=+